MTATKEPTTEKPKKEKKQMRTRNIRWALAAALLALAACAGPGTLHRSTLEDLRIGDENTATVAPFIAAGIGMQISTPVAEVGNVPRSIRFVPIHPDDSYASQANNGPIKDDSARPIPLIEFKLLKLGLETHLGDVQWDLYGDLSLNLAYGLAGYAGEVNERNYTNAPGTGQKGAGAALTYWDASYKPIFIPGIRSDFLFPAGDGSIILGAGIRSYDLIAETGWDRFGDLERRADYTLADIKETSAYLGYAEENDSFSYSVMLGVNFLGVEERYPRLEVDKGFPLFVAYNLEWRW